MIDFTSSLYLGIRHASGTLLPWEQLTTGVPAALAEPPAAAQVAGRLAQLQGCEAAVLAPSTLHLFWDLFGILGRERPVIFMDEGVYPIARWGVERAAALGAAVQITPHRDPAGLERALKEAPAGRRKVVVADGVCACCGLPLPLGPYLRLVRKYGGLLVLDDTQALGLLGQNRDLHDPYGRGGGGSLRFAGLRGPEVILLTSLAKGFGAPLAALSGNRALVAYFTKHSETRVHCSPPSQAAIHSALGALEWNAADGDRLRQELAGNIRRFRRMAAGAGIAARGRLSPVQTVALPPGLDAPGIYRRLLAQGLKTVLRQEKAGGEPLLSLVITARHTQKEIEAAVRLLAGTIRGMKMTNESNSEQYQVYPFEVLPFTYREPAGEAEALEWEEERGPSRRRYAPGYGRNTGGYAKGQPWRRKGKFSPVSGVRPGTRLPKRPKPKPFPPRRFPYPWPMPVTVLPDPYGVGQRNGGQPGDGTGAGSQNGGSMDPGSGDRGSEFVRWVKSALNQVMSLNLPVDGILDAQTRSAIRSFQEKNNLPADGIVGPDTERALLAARAEQASGANANGKSASNGHGKASDQDADASAAGDTGGSDTGASGPGAEGEYSLPARRTGRAARSPQKTPPRPALKTTPPKLTGTWLAPFTSSAIPKYSDRLGKLRATDCSIYVPQNALKQATIDLMVFFHGDPGPCASIFDPDPKTTSKKFRLDVQIDQSGRRVALAVPVLHWIRGSSSNLKNKGVWTAANLNQFVEEVLDQIGKQTGLRPKLGSLILAGHSHAFAILTPLACEFERDEQATQAGALAKLKEVWAMDTTYSLEHVHALDVWSRKLPACQFSALLSSIDTGPLKFWQTYFSLDDYCKAGIKIPANLNMRPVASRHCFVPFDAVKDQLSTGKGASSALIKETGFEGMFSETNFEDFLWKMDEMEWNEAAAEEGSP